MRYEAEEVDGTKQQKALCSVWSSLTFPPWLWATDMSWMAREVS